MSERVYIHRDGLKKPIHTVECRRKTIDMKDERVCFLTIPINTKNKTRPCVEGTLHTFADDIVRMSNNYRGIIISHTDVLQ